MGGLALRIHAFLPLSRANGPGARVVVWVQGCSLGCPGCYNPETHPFAAGEAVSVDTLFRRIQGLGNTIEGITLSGGEPLQQPRALLALLQRVRVETGLSVLVFTGYTWEEVRRMRGADALLACIDVLIAGRFDPARRLARDLRGSANKTVHMLTGRYTLDDLRSVPSAEVIIGRAGEVVVSGIDPVGW